MRIRLFRPTNRKIRLLVGLMVAGLFCIQCTKTDAFRESQFVQQISGVSVGNTPSSTQASIEQLAKTDQIGFLEHCLEHYQGRYRDYTCTFIKEEVINGSKKPEQWIDVKFMDEPFSVAMQWTKNAPLGEAVLFVEGSYGNQMLVKPKGILYALVGTVRREPDGREAMQNTLRPVNMFGFERALENLLGVYRKAQANGHLKESFGGYANVAGRKTVVLVRHLPAEEDYPAYKTLIYVDTDNLIPVCIEGYDWDEQLASRYIYKDIKFNVGLTEDEFLPEANGMKTPK